MSKKSKYPEIQAELRQREAESRAIRKQIHESSGLDRWNFWNDKRELGSNTRYVLLAYAFLRGMPYAVCEIKCEYANRPAPHSLQNFLLHRGHDVSLDVIKNWFKGQRVEKAVAA